MANYRKLNYYWSLKMQQRFFSRFTELVEHGFTISNALEVMSALFRSDRVQMMLESCKSGLPFADTLEASAFEERVIYIIRCSERSGSLLQGLQKAKIYSQSRHQNQKEFRTKLRYPSFLFSIMLTILSGIYLFFIPQIDTFYETFNIEGNHSSIEGIILIIGVTLGFMLTLTSLVILTLKFNHIAFQTKVKQTLFKWLGIRQILQRIFTYYFSSQWLMLIECGLALKESLSTMQSFERIPLFRLIVSELDMRLQNGESLESVIKSSPYFTPYFKLIMIYALQIGCIESELAQFTTSELASLNSLITTFFKVIQAIFLVLIGVIIILLYLSILQPIFEMVQLL